MVPRALASTLPPSLVPRPHPQEEERVLYLTSEFLVVLNQHAYGNFVMQWDSHVTAVAPFEQRSLCIRLQRRSCFLFIARSRRSAWKDAYQQLTGRVVAGMATALPSCCLCSAVLAVGNRRRAIIPVFGGNADVCQFSKSFVLPNYQFGEAVHYICKSPCFSNLAKAV